MTEHSYSDVCQLIWLSIHESIYSKLCEEKNNSQKVSFTQFTVNKLLVLICSPPYII